MTIVTHTFNLPESHLTVLAEEAQAVELTQDQAMAQAIRLYQLINQQARKGLRLAFVDAAGNVVKDPFPGLPSFE